MNAAAKEINQINFFNGQLSRMRLSKKSGFHLLLLFAVLVSALSVVYVTNMHRMTFSELQSVEQTHHQLELQWGQLLLEQASLGTPGRVEELAAEKLNMVLPADNKTIIVRLK